MITWLWGLYSFSFIQSQVIGLLWDRALIAITESLSQKPLLESGCLCVPVFPRFAQLFDCCLCFSLWWKFMHFCHLLVHIIVYVNWKCYHSHAMDLVLSRLYAYWNILLWWCYLFWNWSPEWDHCLSDCTSKAPQLGRQSGRAVTGVCPGTQCSYKLERSSCIQWFHTSIVQFSSEHFRAAEGQAFSLHYGFVIGTRTYSTLSDVKFRSSSMLQKL